MLVEEWKLAPTCELLPYCRQCPHRMFTTHLSFTRLRSTLKNSLGRSHADNLRFADGTSVCFAGVVRSRQCLLGTLTRLVRSVLTQQRAPQYPSPTGSVALPLPADSVSGITPYSILTSSPCSTCPRGSNGLFAPVGKLVSGPNGDWDTGPGMEPDGALINLPDAGSTLTPSAAYFLTYPVAKSKATRNVRPMRSFPRR